VRVLQSLQATALACIWLAYLSGWSSAEGLKTSEDFDALPTPVKLYVLQLGVEIGLKNPTDVTVGEETAVEKRQMFNVPVANSDLNADGEPDYFAAACMF
jgi:hypothetical protein